MAVLRVGDTAVRVELRWWERPFAGWRRRVEVPLTAIGDVERVEHPTRRAATPGGRSGAVVTGVLKVGRWGVGTRTRQFVSVRRTVPAVRITTDRAVVGYDELLVSTPNAEDVVAVLSR
ncbi:hypothetical protein [Allokutzneria sp. NRRL B-24872]|uniref:hypothetical protein n=1 Tax=Allokutzneria sp. NRRL B-24872 TaxID=1137961 RepID=UPI000A3B63A9|nr:hypothetical protein [Allokutzneria sp. NRRL B-24872]